MKMTFKTAILLITICIFSSCNKDNDKDTKVLPDTDVLLTKVINTKYAYNCEYITEYSFEYNSDNKVVKMYKKGIADGQFAGGSSATIEWDGDLISSIVASDIETEGVEPTVHYDIKLEYNKGNIVSYESYLGEKKDDYSVFTYDEKGRLSSYKHEYEETQLLKYDNHDDITEVYPFFECKYDDKTNPYLTTSLPQAILVLWVMENSYIISQNNLVSAMTDEAKLTLENEYDNNRLSSNVMKLGNIAFGKNTYEYKTAN